MGIGDVYELIAEHDLNGQIMQNVYFFDQRIGAIAAPGEDNLAHSVANGWAYDHLDTIRACQSADVLYTSVKVRNLFNASEVHTELLAVRGTNGAQGADKAAPFVAIDFEMQGDNAEVKTGRKRLAGVVDGDQNSGVLVGPGILTRTTTALSTFIRPIQAWNGVITQDTFWPVTVKRVKEVEDDENGVERTTYRLPSILAEKVVSTIVRSFFDVILSSQVSRRLPGNF